MGRIEQEKQTVRRMIALYCLKKEGNKELCSPCLALFEYAEKRLDKCKFGDSKPVCRKCPVHCYAPIQRERIRQIMRYSGPRLIFYHPIAAIRHVLSK